MRITMNEMRGAQKLLTAATGSRRYGYAVEGSNRDVCYLTPDVSAVSRDPETEDIHYAWSARTAQRWWGHPLLMGALSGDCEGDGALPDFLAKHRERLAYAAPWESAMYGLACIAVNEKAVVRSGAPTAAKTALLAAFILRHMAEVRDDPFRLDEAEKAVLSLAREGRLDAEERAILYRKAICPANLNKLRKMPDNTALRDGFFRLLDEGGYLT